MAGPNKNVIYKVNSELHLALRSQCPRKVEIKRNGTGRKMVFLEQGDSIRSWVLISRVRVVK